MMKSLLESIFGTYEPVVYEFTSKFLQQNQELIDGEVYTYDSVQTVTNEVVASGAAGVDWPYVLGVLGFFLVVYCIFRIIGGLAKNV